MIFGADDKYDGEELTEAEKGAMGEFHKNDQEIENVLM